MKRGQRLAYEGKTIGRQTMITDGPFGESKEVIGGYWFILANKLHEAAQIAKGNPCLNYGFFREKKAPTPQIAAPPKNPWMAKRQTPYPKANSKQTKCVDGAPKHH